MFGCLRRIGCLGVLALGVLLWLTRDRWLPLVERWRGGDEEAVVDTWQPITQGSAERGERAVRALAQPRGPVYVTLRAGELASYAFLSLAPGLPVAARDAQAAVVGERVYMKTVVAPGDLGGALGGSLGGLLAERDTLRLGGTFDVVRPGLAQFQVQDVQFGRFPLPARVLPTLVARVRGGPPPEGVAADALPVPIPEYIGDVRVARGRVTLYRTTTPP